jgi:hypothetical protein
VVTAALLAAMSGGARAEAPLASEVKAAFLFNFTKFVEWPAAAFGSGAAPLMVCVSAGDAMASMIEEVMRNKSISGRPLQLQRVRTPAAARACHVMFVDGDIEKKPGRMLEGLHGAAILTVGDSESFLKSGGIIRILERDRRMTFEVNIDAAARAGIKISSRLLALGTTVTDSYARTR